jgi:hypothetical protein
MKAPGGVLYPPVADLISDHVQRYSDGQLKWILENGIRFTEMPGQLREMLEESGKWKTEAPTGHDHHQSPGETGGDAHAREEPGEHQQEIPSDHGEMHPPAGHDSEHQHGEND